MNSNLVGTVSIYTRMTNANKTRAMNTNDIFFKRKVFQTDSVNYACSSRVRSTKTNGLHCYKFLTRRFLYNTRHDSCVPIYESAPKVFLNYVDSRRSAMQHTGQRSITVKVFRFRMEQKRC